MKKISLVIFSFLVIIAILTATSRTNIDSRCERYMPKDMVLIKGDSISGDFYICTHEVSNYEYLLYLEWLKSTFERFPEVYEYALPDSMVFQKHLSETYNDPLLYNYIKHPSFTYYPVVGVNWMQANNFCIWQTNRINEYITKIWYFILNDTTPDDVDDGSEKPYNMYNYSITNRRIKDELCLIPNLRLPTEYEWELAYKYILENKIYAKVTPGLIMDYRGMDYDVDVYAIKYNWDAVDIDGMPTDILTNVSKVLGMDNNVSEWVADDYYEGKSIVKLNNMEIYEDLKKNSYKWNDTANAKKEYKIFRGGSFMEENNQMKRGFLRYGQSRSDIGFRFVMTKVN